MQNVRCCTSCSVVIISFFSSVLSVLSFFFSLSPYRGCCMLLALLLAIAVCMNKYFAASLGRKGWSACAGLRNAGLGCLLPLHSVWSGAIVGRVLWLVQ